MAHHSTGAPSDMFTEREARQLLANAMSDYGIEPDTVEVVVWEDNSPYNEKMGFVVGKQINGEMEKLKTTISYPVGEEPTHLQQRIASAANNIASAFRDEMISSVRICGTEIRFCRAEGGWAECARCNARVTLSECTSPCSFVEAAETSNPMPSPYHVEDFLQRLDDGHTEVLKLYLFGALRRRCECEFGGPKDLSMGSPY